MKLLKSSNRDDFRFRSFTWITSFDPGLSDPRQYSRVSNWKGCSCGKLEARIYHTKASLCNQFLQWMSFIIQFLMILMSVGCLWSFSKVVGTKFGIISQSLTFLFSAMTMLVKIAEKHLMTKVQKHEILKFLIENESNAIKNFVSKALSDREISEKMFWCNSYKNKKIANRKSEIVLKSIENKELVMLPRNNDFSVWNKTWKRKLKMWFYQANLWVIFSLKMQWKNENKNFRGVFRGDTLPK